MHQATYRGMMGSDIIGQALWAAQCGSNPGASTADFFLLCAPSEMNGLHIDVWYPVLIIQPWLNLSGVRYCPLLAGRKSE